jgi:hypothetical protein
MPIPAIWWIDAVLVVAAGIVTVRLAAAWLHWRGDRRILCPENRRPAGVRVDARHAAATALVHKVDLRLSSCSRWPEHAACGQQCLSQIQAAPEDCLVRNILVRWYEGKSCASCGLPFGKIQGPEIKPALMRPDRISLEWSEIPADELDETLRTALPVCFACHMANTLVRVRPDLVTDRPGRTSTT